MAGIVPVPTTRMSQLMARQRLVGQLQTDQLDLFRLQQQVSTGRRVLLPSDDAPAAQRAMTLQRLLERKTQLRSNVDTGQLFLAASDAALDGVATQLGFIRGQALGAADSTVDDATRQQTAKEVSQVIDHLLNVANRQFQGRYLFAGSQTNVKPYGFDGHYVRYSGNNKLVNNHSDIGVLFASNSTGLEIFGGVSDEVLGDVDLNPHVSSDTLLSSLRGGRGISPNGALAVSDGVNSVVVDISRAVTLGDVARLIESNPPAGRTLTANISGNGLTLQIDATGGGNLSVTEVASGTAARELGIFNKAGVLTNPLVGDDLEPLLLPTTRVGDLLGSKARARLLSPGGNNDLFIEATTNGAQYNGVAIQIVDDELLTAAPGLVQGQEYAEFSSAARAARAALRFSGAGNDLTVTATAPGTDFNNVDILVTSSLGLGNAAIADYDAGAKRLTITVDSAGATTIDAVVNAINGSTPFSAAHDSSVEGAYNPAALVNPADVGNVQGNTGNSGGEANTLYINVNANASTANDVAAAINDDGTFRAEVEVGDATSSIANGTGLIPLSATAVTAGGNGAALDLASGIRIVNGGQTHTLTFEDAETVEDILNILNAKETGLQAEINAAGTGINVRSRLSGSDLQIGENGGQTATQLGIRSFSGQTRLSDFNHGQGVSTKFDTYEIIPNPAPASYTDFTIVVDDGVGGVVELPIDVHGAGRVQDVLDQINNHPDNNVGGVAVQARLAAVGNGIEIVDVNGRPLTIRAAEGSPAAEQLGLLPAGSAETTSAAGVITGADRHYVETHSVFTTLIRLRDALLANDFGQISEAIALIDGDIDRAVFARAEIGAREQSLDVTKRTLEFEDVQLKSALSNEIDVDLVEAISNLTARQMSLEASLRTMANIMQLSLLNFL